jgi:hypothetical protein
LVTVNSFFILSLYLVSNGLTFSIVIVTQVSLEQLIPLLDSPFLVTRNFILKLRMNFKILYIHKLFLISVLGQSSNDPYIFASIAPYINPINLFDGPPSVAQASSTTRTIQPDPSLIQYYNYFSASVYCTDTIQNLTCFYCQHFNSSVTYHKILTNEALATMALLSVHSDRKEIVVTFRGTTNLPNVLADFTFVEVPSEPGVKIHKGFYIATLSLYYKVKNIYSHFI